MTLRDFSSAVVMSRSVDDVMNQITVMIRNHEAIIMILFFVVHKANCLLAMSEEISRKGTMLEVSKETTRNSTDFTTS